MKIRHIILLLLKAAGDSIASKTKIQKQLYFISLLLEKDFGFAAHYYGPYSAEVEQGLNELIGAGFVNMSQEVFGIDSNWGFEVKRYTFSLAESGRELAGDLADENSQEYGKIEQFVIHLEKIGDPGYLSLSVAAKAYFILNKEEAPMDNTQIRERAKEFGWQINDSQIEKASKILKQLELIE